jgi:peptidoglycan DL-endopeptidase CwlO
MSRRVVTVVLGALLTLGMALPASADSVSDKKAEGARIAAKKDKLREQQEVLADKINAAVGELDVIAKDVSAALVQLGEQDATISKLSAQAFQFAVNSYMLGSASSGLGAILAPGGIGNDSAQRDGYSSVLLGGSADVTDQVKAVRQDTNKLKNLLVAKQKRQAELKATLDKTQAQIAKAQVELDALAQQNDAELAQAIRDAELATERRLQAEAAAVIQQRSEAFRQGKEAGPAIAATPTNNGGGDDLPVATVKPAAKPAKPVAKPGTPAAPAAAAGAAKPPTNTVAPTPGEAVTTVPIPVTSKAPKPKPVAPPAPAVSGAAGRAVAAAYSQLGTPYVFAMSSPKVGFDCSGLTSWAWAQAGVSIQRTSQQQWASLPHVPLDQVQPGDLIFYYSDVHHVAIYIGGGQVIHAPFSGSSVSVSGINGHVIGAARPG